MKVLLAGYNIDTEVINDLVKNSPNRNDVTPEILSASYARISRDPMAINELRKAAREEVEKARRSNKNIIFSMGHHSVAEHAVFNFDIIGISRLAIEELEHHRLCSYTEKSQRYITLGNDFVIPKEIADSKYKDIFITTANLQNEFYHKLYKKLYEYVFKKYADLANDPKKHNLLDGWAKEDARYITSLSIEGQLGLTINARNLELVLRRFASHRFSEVKDLGEELWRLVEKVAPSIILFYKSNDFDEKTYPELKAKVEDLKLDQGWKKEGKEVELINFTHHSDDITTASLIHTSTNLPFKKCLQTAKKMNLDKKLELIKSVFKYMEFYDSTIREFEHVGLTYEIVLSASCFAQLKRHRISTITCQGYNPYLGITIPESIIEIGMKNEFMDVIKKTEDVYYKIEKDLPDTAVYILTNSHRKRILFSCNARELYHISRLREDQHAQWDIRNVTGKMAEEAKKVMPLTMLLAGGKDRYPELYKEVFGCLPKGPTVTVSASPAI